MCAPVCSSFVWISRGTTKRSAIAPLGDESVECVRAALSFPTALNLKLALRIPWNTNDDNDKQLTTFSCVIWVACINYAEIGWHVH